MRTLIGTTATLVLLGLSPWVLPSIAVAAAKMAHQQARNACGSKLGQNRSADRRTARADGRSRNQEAGHACVEPKLAGRKWPWP